MSPPPLANLKLLDLSRQLPGPFCSTILADLGMDTLAVAQPGDPFATGIPFLARNKRSMTLNLKSDAGREILFRLADTADVLLEGFRPGVTKRLGIDYHSLSARNPWLIYCSISGYGQDGPYRDRVGHDVNYLGYAGVLNYLGEEACRPILPGVQIADIGAGSLMAAVGILTAVIARQQTGRGQYIDIAMLDGAFAWNVYHLLLRQLSGAEPRRGREAISGGFACYNVYETRDGRYVTVGAYEPHFWATLCRQVGREDLIPLQWDEARREEIVASFRATFREKTFDEWMQELGDKDICFGPVNTIGDALADPQLRHRGMVVEMETPGGTMVMPNSPIKLSETPPSLRTPPPQFGEHTDAVLQDLGFSANEIDALRAQGVV